MPKTIKLKIKTSFVFLPKPPYSFDATIHKPSHFPSSDNEWARDRYWITMLWRDKILGLKLEDKETKVNMMPIMKTAVITGAGRGHSFAVQST